jgi:two-component system response regulator AlgR
VKSVVYNEKVNWGEKSVGMQTTDAAGGRGILKIYILDKESREIQRLLSWLSQDRRVSAEVFGDSQALVNRIAEAPAEICIIRLGLLDIQGLRTAAEIKKIHPGAKIIFISNDGDYALDAYEVGAAGYLLCPVKRDKFEKCLREVI